PSNSTTPPDCVVRCFGALPAIVLPLHPLPLLRMKQYRWGKPRRRAGASVYTRSDLRRVAAAAIRERAGADMSFRVLSLTAKSYSHTVREACASLLMPYRVRQDERNGPTAGRVPVPRRRRRR